MWYEFKIASSCLPNSSESDLKPSRVLILPLVREFRLTSELLTELEFILSLQLPQLRIKQLQISMVLNRSQKN